MLLPECLKVSCIAEASANLRTPQHNCDSGGQHREQLDRICHVSTVHLSNESRPSKSRYASASLFLLLTGSPFCRQEVVVRVEQADSAQENFGSNICCCAIAVLLAPVVVLQSKTAQVQID